MPKLSEAQILKQKRALKRVARSKGFSKDRTRRFVFGTLANQAKARRKKQGVRASLLEQS